MFHPVFLAEVPLADKLDLYTIFRRQTLGALSNPIPERLGKLRIVENPDLPLVQERCHPTGEADPRQSAKNQHPVPATQHAFNLSGVSLG